MRQPPLLWGGHDHGRIYQPERPHPGEQCKQLYDFYPILRPRRPPNTFVRVGYHQPCIDTSTGITAPREQRGSRPMSKRAEGTKYTKFTDELHPQHRCPDCGRWAVDPDQHTCKENEVFDGICPMCEESYRSFLDHMARCDP